MSTTTDLTTLKINYLTQAQYDAAVEGGTINADEIYMTPAEEEFSGMLQVKQTSGNIVTFSDGARLPAQSLIANIEAVQSGSGTPSSSNVRAISGWDSVTVYATGKNLWGQIIPGYFINNGVINSAASNSNFIGPKIPVDASKTYVFSLLDSGYTGSILFGQYRADGTWITYTSAVYANSISYPHTRTYTWASNTAYVIPYGYSGSGVAIIDTLRYQLEQGSTATDYEAYASAHTITLPSTVYGGTLDVASGKLIVTHGYIESYAGETLPSTWISDRNVYASGTTPSTGAQVVYELASPQTYALTPLEISMMLGANNVWAESGDIELSYIAIN